MIPFPSALNERDRGHIRTILSSTVVSRGAEKPPLAKVPAFLRDSTFVDDDAVEAFRALGQEAREQVISELIWRVTCHLDRSTTQVGGMNVFPLGLGFGAALLEQGGGDVFVLTVKR